MAKYVYIVTRIVIQKREIYGTAIPNLGVHSSLEKAIDHFNDIKKDRLEYKNRYCRWDNYLPKNKYDSRHLYRVARLESDIEIEELRIEKWNYTK